MHNYTNFLTTIAATILLLPSSSFSSTAYKCLGSEDSEQAWVAGEVEWAGNNVYWKAYRFSSLHEARAKVEQRCAERHPLKARFSNFCVNQAAAASCSELEVYSCWFSATVGDQWRRYPPRYMSIDAGNIAIAAGNHGEKLRNWIENFCPVGVARRLWGFPSAMAGENFCEEAAQSLKCSN